MSYDPELDLVYYGVGNPSPYNSEQRLGDNKWTGSVLARHPADGALVWAYQFTPHDNWDYDAVSTMILADVKLGGRLRKALVTFNKNGFQYTLDRATGEVLAAPPYVQVTWATGIDLKTGRPILDSTKLTGASKGTVKDVCPSLEGGVSPSSPAAYSPRTGWFYTSTNNMCMDFAATPRAAPSGDAIHRRRDAVSRRPGRTPRRLHGVGRQHGSEGVGEHGAFSQLERRAGDRG
jgi:glucose dehydrogenase